MSPALADDFVLEEVLGRGGMGTVRAALQRSTGRRVAIKLLPADALDADRVARFDREAAALSRLGHPNIVHIYTHGRDADGRPFLAMELVAGRTLQAVLAAEGALDVARAVTLATQVVEGLAYAHERHIAHRDVKPSNVMVARVLDRELVKLVDFGLAKLLDESADGGTASGRLLGSAPYMSPEQWNQLEDIDGRADLYSFGCVLYEMLTGRPPYDASGMVGYLKAHLAGACAPPEALRPELVEHPEVLAVLARVMATDRDRRPPSAMALLAELRPLELRYRAALAPLPPVAPARPAAAAGTAPTLSSDGELGRGWVSNVATEPAPSAVDLGRRRRWLVPVIAAALGAAAAAVLVLGLSAGPEVAAPAGDPPSVALPEAPPPAEGQVPANDDPDDGPSAADPVAVTPEAPDEVAEPPREAVPEASVVAHIVSTPRGARVVYDGAVRGRTPFELTLREGGPTRVTLRLRGYAPRTVDLDPATAAAAPTVVTLTRAARHEPAPDPEPSEAPTLNLDRLPIE